METRRFQPIDKINLGDDLSQYSPEQIKQWLDSDTNKALQADGKDGYKIYQNVLVYHTVVKNFGPDELVGTKVGEYAMKKQP